MARFELIIENEQPLSCLELKEILSIIDGYVLSHASPYYDAGLFDFAWPTGRRAARPRRWDYLEIESGDVSFIEIEVVRPGSIILTVLGGAAAFGLGAIAVGVRRSRLGSELARFGENVGDILGEGVSRINEALEDWTDRNMKLRDRKTRVSFKRVPDEPESFTKARRK